jgi:hypothetical protein
VHNTRVHAAPRCGAWLAWALLLGSIAPAFAQSNDDTRHLSISTGIRFWHAQWDSWNVNPRATGVAVGDDRYEVVESRRGSTELALIPFVSLRYGSVFLSASAMTSTDYTLHETATPGGFDVNALREERDLNLGYLFGSGVSTTLGYKQIRQRFGSDEYTWKGPVLGLTVSRPLAEGWGLYGALALGRLKGEFPIADITGATRFDADYRLADMGLTYNFGPSGRIVRAVVLTAGYRTQYVATKNYGLAVIPSPSSGDPPRLNTRGTLVDTTQGVVLGLQASF